METLTERVKLELRRREALKELQRRSLYDFFVGAWDTLEPGRDLDLGWHVELICEYLQAVDSGDIKYLLINIAPRHLKSKIVSVAFPCWVWLNKPEMRFLCLSFVSSLANDLNYERRRLIQSDWYQSLSGGLTLSFAKNRVNEFGNDHQGAMLSRGLESGVTGSGGDIILCDDPNNPENVESEEVRKAANRRFSDYSTTRKNKPDAPVVVIQQRTHDNDVSGVILKEWGDYTKLILPTIAEKKETIIFPISKKEIVRNVGDFLHASRFGATEATEAQRRLGEYMFACRHQQNPAPSEGGIFKRSKWVLYKSVPLRFTRKFISVDCAFKDSKKSSYVVIQVWGQRPKIDPLGKPEWNYYLLFQIRDHLGFDATERAIRDTWKLYPDVYKVLIEDKANGTAICERFEREFGEERIERINPGSDSKEARANAIVPVQQRGSILLPCSEEVKPTLEMLGKDTISVEEFWKLYPPDEKGSSKYIPTPQWCKDFIDEHALVPNGQYMDQVDAADQCILYGEGLEITEYKTGSLGMTRQAKRR